jgi:hypothetical protein
MISIDAAGTKVKEAEQQKSYGTAFVECGDSRRNPA